MFTIKLRSQDEKLIARRKRRCKSTLESIERLTIR
jgi:hypothetical protein